MTEKNYKVLSAIDEPAVRSSKFGLRHSTFVSPADSFHRDLHKDLKADYILANPPFNMSDWGGDIHRGERFASTTTNNPGKKAWKETA